MFHDNLLCYIVEHKAFKNRLGWLILGNIQAIGGLLSVNQANILFQC